ncbi:MAG TPA: hypothetical protein VFE30_18675 [Anaeromyxobacteraceae bacterium]|jgi:hypothetical protein|nr:hypothetical protein [Anaeromyxobacteraceae bacterium]
MATRKQRGGSPTRKAAPKRKAIPAGFGPGGKQPDPQALLDALARQLEAVQQATAQAVEALAALRAALAPQGKKMMMGPTGSGDQE